MKKVTLHIFSFIMAFLVIFSTMSFTVEKHFCGKSLVGHAVFSSVEKCKSEMHTCGAEEMAHMNMKKDACCTNQVEKISGQDELNVSSFSFDFAPQFLAVSIPFIQIDLIEELPSEIIPYPPYEPPKLVYDLHVLCQVFII